MPAGISWPRYLIFMFASMVSMFSGAQVVHNFYQPLQDLPKYVEQEKIRLRALKKNET